ncbi:hypothetical protein SNE40_004888 [Patella caerulea]|uniref:Uncharacterized protein n=1 Tax=Patella caerulea TaxID=87958 RepID=A0AAN8K3V3_PATCE
MNQDRSIIVTPLNIRPKTVACKNNQSRLLRHSSLRNIYGRKCSITLLGEEEYLNFQSRPYSSINLYSSSSSPSVPYSTTDILYNGETGRSSLAEDYSPKDLVYFDKDKSTRLRDGDIRRPTSRNNSRRSLSLEKVSINGDKDELQPIKNSATAAKQNHFRPAGIRQSYLRGEQYHSNNSTPKINTSSHGIEKDDLVAMGTIWNPNSVAKNSVLSLNKPYSVNSVTNSSAAPIRRGPSTSRFSMGTGASRSRDVEPKYTDPAMAAPASFQQRLIDLSALEAETVRWERSKKVKKKSKQDRDS